MSKEGYLTVGELADKAGVTVRTIQYYDQEGLLCPSARGPQNQRLYTEENITELYRILSLKYLKLSLAEIKSEVAHSTDSQGFRKLVGQQMDDIEKGFQQIFKRFTTLRTLIEKTSEDKDVPIKWEEVAQIIEGCQDENQFFWRLTCIREDDLDHMQEGDILIRQEMISRWHELIADAISLIAEREPANSKRNMNLAERYLALDESQQTLSIDQNFILMENIAPHKHDDDGSFDALRMTVIKHLESVVAIYNQQKSKELLS